MKVFTERFDIVDCLQKTYENGYCFSNETDSDLIEKLLKEVKFLPLEYGNHIINPINQNKTYKVTQSHERYYSMLGDVNTPIANALCKQLKKLNGLEKFFELSGWYPNEIGYQKYRSPKDYISPHRDRWSDKKLSLTFTISGKAKIKIYKSLTEPVDYSFIEQIDEFETQSGTVMFLRAPGFGNGNQVIHEVLPPVEYPRYILNLRTRVSLLPQPSNQEKIEY